MKLRALQLAALLAVSTVPAVRAETLVDDQFWAQFTAQGSLGAVKPEWKNLRWWFEGQARFYPDMGRLSESMVRPGLGYAIADNMALWVGYAWIPRSLVGAGIKDFDEHRVWQQFSWATKTAYGTLSTRTRLEQRFVETGHDTGWRLRQLVKFIYPLEFEPRLSLVGYDEIFVNLNSTDWGASDGFDHNRAFAGLGWNFDQAGHWRTEIGYMNQFVQNPRGDDRLNNLLVANILVNY